MTVKAIYENGQFRPVEPVNLPENTLVEVTLPSDVETAQQREAREEIVKIMSRRYNSGQRDTAERHNEHQP
jgi:predicted DNA-binding antitoxin AbrB/MazE fold protein